MPQFLDSNCDTDEPFDLGFNSTRGWLLDDSLTKADLPDCQFDYTSDDFRDWHAGRYAALDSFLYSQSEVSHSITYHTIHLLPNVLTCGVGTYMIYTNKEMMYLCIGAFLFLHNIHSLSKYLLTLISNAKKR